MFLIIDLQSNEHTMSKRDLSKTHVRLIISHWTYYFRGRFYCAVNILFDDKSAYR